MCVVNAVVCICRIEVRLNSYVTAVRNVADINICQYVCNVCLCIVYNSEQTTDSLVSTVCGRHGCDVSGVVYV